MSYEKDRTFGDDHMDAVKQTLGPFTTGITTAAVDRTQAADLTIINAAKQIGVRTRRPGFAARYPWDFTIRSKRDNGVETEWAKLRKGFCDWIFYCHSDPDRYGKLLRWMIIDMDVWRANDTSGREISNGDGTYFRAFDARMYPAEMIIGSEPAVPHIGDSRYGAPPDDRVVERGSEETPCPKCDSHNYVDVDAADGKIRRDCDECGFFKSWTKW